MAFASLTFLYIFLPAVLIAYYALPKKFRTIVLLTASYIFIAYIHPVYCIPLLIATATGFFGGLYLRPEYESAVSKKPILTGCIIMNAALLLFCRFLFDIMTTSYQESLSFFYLMAPLGIAVYTLQSISYLVDVYNGNVQAESSIIRYAAYLAFFPKVVAGPVVRYGTMRESLANPSPSIEKMSSGIGYFIKGLSKKVLLANNMSALWETLRTPEVLENLPFLSAWIGIVAFAFKIYFEFSGYTDMAVGLGKMFGFELPSSFAYPLAGFGISDFLKRWNMTVSNWIRSYIILPLKKKGTTSYILTTFLLTTLLGLWHGFYVNFWIWGVYLGSLILLEHFIFKDKLNEIPKIASILYTVLVLLLGWVIFAFRDWQHMLLYLKALFGLNGGVFGNQQTLNYLSNFGILLIICTISATKLTRFLSKRFTGIWEIIKPFAQGFLLIICTALLINSSFNPFFS